MNPNEQAVLGGIAEEMGEKRICELMSMLLNEGFESLQATGGMDNKEEKVIRFLKDSVITDMFNHGG